MVILDSSSNHVLFIHTISKNVSFSHFHDISTTFRHDVACCSNMQQQLHTSDFCILLLWNIMGVCCRHTPATVGQRKTPEICWYSRANLVS